MLAESYERIHRSNLVGMGILPLELPGTAASLGLKGDETFDIQGLAGIVAKKRGGQTVKVHCKRKDGSAFSFDARVRIDTPNEFAYYEHGGILHYVLRQLLK